MDYNCVPASEEGNDEGMKHEKFIEAVIAGCEAKGMKRKDLAQRVGVTESYLSAILNGREALVEKKAKAMADATGADFRLYWDSEPQGQAGEYFPVPLRAAIGSMGPGSMENSRKVKTHLAFREDWIYSKGVPARMSVIPARGTSMTPTIPDGCMVLIDESQTELISGRVYYVGLNDENYFKRLVIERGTWFMASDADGSRREILAHDRFEVFGRAIWYGCEL